MVAKSDRLGTLQVRIARHDCGRVLLRLFAKHEHELLHLRGNRIAFIAQIKPEVERDLVIPAAGGMKALARIANARGELRLHKGVDILRIGINRQLPALKIRKDALQPAKNFIPILLADDPAGAEHCGVRHAPLQILLIHPAVEGDGGIEIVCFLIGLLGEAARPQFHAAPSFPDPARRQNRHKGAPQKKLLQLPAPMILHH